MSFSEDNRALKEDLEHLIGRKEKLEAENNKRDDKKKLLERLPQAEKKPEEARQREVDAEAMDERLKTRVAQIKEADSEHLRRFAKASVEGFQMDLNITTVHTPGINFKFFNGNYVARDEKSYEGDLVSYDPAVDADEEEDTETPPDGDGAETGTA